MSKCAEAEGISYLARHTPSHPCASIYLRIPAEVGRNNENASESVYLDKRIGPWWVVVYDRMRELMSVRSDIYIIAGIGTSLGPGLGLDL
jgi:hypothetical protein